MSIMYRQNDVTMMSRPYLTPPLPLLPKGSCVDCLPLLTNTYTQNIKLSFHKSVDKYKDLPGGGPSTSSNRLMVEMAEPRVEKVKDQTNYRSLYDTIFNNEILSLATAT